MKNLIALALLLGCVAANAALIDLGNKTLDTETGLEWLDLTETLNTTYNQIESGNGGWNALGFRHATHSEIFDLFSHYGFSFTDGGEVVAFGAENSTRQLRVLLGETYSNGTGTGVNGIYDDGVLGRVGFASLDYNYSRRDDRIQLNDSWNRIDYVSATMGHYLIRVSNVPIPAAAYLFASGLGLLGWFRRREQS
jgi:hypothetical protein